QGVAALARRAPGRRRAPGPTAPAPEADAPLPSVPGPSEGDRPETALAPRAVQLVVAAGELGSFGRCCGDALLAHAGPPPGGEVGEATGERQRPRRGRDQGAVVG